MCFCSITIQANHWAGRDALKTHIGKRMFKSSWSFSSIACLVQHKKVRWVGSCSSEFQLHKRLAQSSFSSSDNLKLVLAIFYTSVTSTLELSNFRALLHDCGIVHANVGTGLCFASPCKRFSTIWLHPTLHAGPQCPR